MRDRGYGYGRTEEEDTRPKNMWRRDDALVIFGAPHLYPFCVHCARPAENFPEQEYNVTPTMDALAASAGNIIINVFLVSLSFILPFVNLRQGGNRREVTLHVPLCAKHHGINRTLYYCGVAMLGIGGFIFCYPSIFQVKEADPEKTPWYVFFGVSVGCFLIGAYLLKRGKQSLRVTSDLGGNTIIRGICREYLSWFRST